MTGKNPVLQRLKALFTADPPTKPPGLYPTCRCLEEGQGRHKPRTPVLHSEQQDVHCDAWHRLCERIEQAAASGEEEFTPLEGMTEAERAQIVTLPASIGRLTTVQKLYLYASHLVRVPPEIAGMRSLVRLDIYTSYRLHFLPYEITRCTQLRQSRASTRALFGNYKYRSPFPDLTHKDNTKALSLLAPSACSVCDSPLGDTVLPRWLTIRAGTDWFPLLVNACSPACIEALPPAAEGYVAYPHTGGGKLEQPIASY